MKNLSLTAVFIFLLISCIFTGCEKYLSIKPDKQLATPRSTKDLLAMLDYVKSMNGSNANGIGQAGSDDVFLSDASWNSAAASLRVPYAWEKTPVASSNWYAAYTAILSANTILNELDNVFFDNEEEKRQIQGAALFFRGYLHFHIAQVFAPPFHETTSALAGIPVRLTPDVNVPVRRETVAKTYELIIDDLLKSCRLLSANRQLYPTRPYRAAAYGALARVYLSMGKTGLAGTYADTCLQFQHQLLDFNRYQTSVKPYPFEKFNEEVVFYSEMSVGSLLSESRARIDRSLYDSFQVHDLRKRLFFTEKEKDQFAFTGDYTQNSGTYRFNGITTAEMRLIRMESKALNGLLDEALSDLDYFLAHRYSSPPSVTGKNKKELLDFILSERRKELLFRGIRWSDIRRFSFDEDRAVDLTRNLNNQVVILSREQIQRFAYHIPQEVIDAGGISQNP